MSANVAEDLVALLRSRGWSKIEDNPRGSDLWAFGAIQLPSDYVAHDRPDAVKNVTYQAEMYVPHEVRLGTFLWTDLLERVAAAHEEQRAQLERALEMVRFDVTRFRIDGRHTVPLETGATVISSAFGMMRAAATAARRPRQSIGSNYSKLADEIVREARLAHTEEGSFTFPVALRVNPPEPEPEPETQLDNEVFSSAPSESAERRVTRTLAQAMAAFEKHVVQPATDPSMRDLAPVIIAGGTKEMFANLSRAVSEPDVGWLETGFAWAPIEGIPADPPSRISIPADADARHLISRAVQLLSTSRRDAVRVITGPIIRIEHSPGDPFGEIAVQAPSGTSSRHGRVEAVVRRERLEQIHLWMSQGTTVVLQGEVERRPGRSARLAGIASPRALEDALSGIDDVSA